MRYIAAILCLICATASAEVNVIGKARGTTPPNRIDADTTGRFSVMPETLFANAVLWTPFSYDYTTNVYDLSDAINDCTATSANTAPSWSSANGGKLTFDGVDDHLIRGNTVYGGSGSAAFTASGWVKTDWYGVILSEGRNISRPIWYTRVVGSTALGRLDQLIWNDDTSFQWDERVDYPASVSNIWTHFAITRDGTSWKFYGNGLLMDTVTKTLTGSITMSQFTIGANRTDALTSFFKGDMGSIKIYNRALTSNEVYTSYSSATNTYGVN